MDNQATQENNSENGGESVAGSNTDQGQENREKERDRRGRGARGTRFSDAEGGNRERSREKRNCRVYISNIPYDYRWQDLKDLFRRIVGSVEYVELFHDENGKARGCGIVEFKDPDNVEKALEKLNRYEINGRELVVKEDHGHQRDQFGRIVREGGQSGGGGNNGGGGGGGGNRNDHMDRSFNRRNDDDRLSGRNHNVGNMMSNDYNNASYNSYGLSASFLESLGINGPLHNKCFVANLDYKVDSKKLKQVFKLAGKVQSVDLSMDKEGNSRGFAVIEYDHPVEAVQAISMLDRQMLFDRRMTVRLDRIPDKNEGLKLPEGLGSVGIGLGPNGEPLKDVARNLPSITNQQQQQPQQQQQQQSGNLNLGGGMFNNSVQPSPVAPVSVNKSAGGGNILGPAGGLNLGNLSSSNLAALTNVVGGLGAALSNPLLTSSLSNLGLNLGNAPITPNNDDAMSSATALTNNYSTGNNYSSAYGGSSGYLGGGGGGGGGGGLGGNLGGNLGGGLGGSGNFDNLRNSFNSGGPQENDYNPGSNMDMYGGGGGGNQNTLSGGNGRKSDTIIIKNIPLSCTWQTLRDKFRDVGEVKFAEIRGNDVGVVRFFKERDAELAIALMDGSRMDGRTIQVSFF